MESRAIIIHDLLAASIINITWHYGKFKFKLGFFKLGFVTYIFWIYFSGSYQKKTFYIQITIVPGDIAKKFRKTFHKLEIKNFFSVLNCEFFIVISIIKITFSLPKIAQNYRFPWVNTKTIKYTCRFNTS